MQKKYGGPAMTLAKTAHEHHEHHEDDHYLCCNYHYFRYHYHYILLVVVLSLLYIVIESVTEFIVLLQKNAHEINTINLIVHSKP